MIHRMLQLNGKSTPLCGAAHLAFDPRTIAGHNDADDALKAADATQRLGGTTNETVCQECVRLMQRPGHLAATGRQPKL